MRQDSLFIILNPEFMCVVPVSGLYTLGCFFSLPSFHLEEFPWELLTRKIDMSPSLGLHLAKSFFLYILKGSVQCSKLQFFLPFNAVKILHHCPPGWVVSLKKSAVR